MDQPIKMIMNCIKSEVCYPSVVDGTKDAPLSDERLERLYRLAKSHDLAHIVGSALFRRGILPEGSEWTEKFKKQMMVATFRYEQMQVSLTELCEALEEAKIPFLPLKGSVLRQYYPEPWMRTSCDIDILVRQEDLERAKKWLVSKLSYQEKGMHTHDISLFSPLGVHLELHYDLVEEGLAQNASSVLRDVWRFSVVKEGWGYRYEMTDAMFYFYHVAHMAKHFESAGCGIRPLVDLWVLDHRVEHNVEDRRLLLEQGGLMRFALVARKLCEIWFADAEPDELSLQVETYILTGGVYGNQENHISIQQGKRGGKLSYALSRIFLKYDLLKFRYPILIKYKWLLPVMQVRRWGALIFCGGFKRSVKELKLNQNLSRDKAENIQVLLKRVGL